jgi:hypothetical protein
LARAPVESPHAVAARAATVFDELQTMSFPSMQYRLTITAFWPPGSGAIVDSRRVHGRAVQ